MMTAYVTLTTVLLASLVLCTVSASPFHKLRGLGRHRALRSLPRQGFSGDTTGTAPTQIKQCPAPPKRDGPPKCDFYVDGPSGKSWVIPLNQNNGYTSSFIKHGSDKITYATGCGTCWNTKEDPSLCSSFEIINSGRPPPYPGNPPRIRLKPDKRTQGVKGQRFVMFFRELSIIVGDGPDTNKYLTWDMDDKKVPKRTRCIQFTVS